MFCFWYPLTANTITFVFISLFLRAKLQHLYEMDFINFALKLLLFADLHSFFKRTEQII